MHYKVDLVQINVLFSAVCPVGSRENRELGECEPCPAATYQEREGQTDCDRCQTGLTSRRGAYTRKQCK